MTTEAEPKNLLPEAKHYQLRGGIPNSPLSVSVISALLGGLLFGFLALAAGPWLGQLGQGWTWARPQLGVYLACMGLFHLCEFWTTAGWNAQKLSVDGEYPSQSCALSEELIISLPAQQRGDLLVLSCYRACGILHLVLLLAKQVRVRLCLLPFHLHR
jgi:hypothetical protein